MTTLLDRPLKLSRAMKRRHGSGGFGIEILYPGLGRGRDDTGIATIGRIDDALVQPGTLIAMHPHRDDEILTYLRSGRVRHTDSEGHVAEISNRNLMLMGAGRRFEHEEQVLPGEPLRGLQIFLRPAQQGLRPVVHFRELDVPVSVDAWRRLAGPDEADALRVRSRTWIHDIELSAGAKAALPTDLPADILHLLYVFEGELRVAGSTLTAGDSLLGSDLGLVVASETTDAVLFTTDETAEVFKGGMFSGNQLAGR